MAGPNTIQMGGVISIALNDDTAATPAISGGWFDVSEYVTMVTGELSRADVSTTATYGKPYQEHRAGVKEDKITIEFLDDLKASAFNDRIFDIVQSEKATMHFKVRFTTDAISTNNKEYYGSCVVLNNQVGGSVGNERKQSQTYPVNYPGLQRRSA